MRQKLKLTEGQLKQIVEGASRMVIQEMLGYGSPFGDKNARTFNDAEGLTGDMGRMARNASKSALNFMPGSTARKSSNRLDFMPSNFTYRPNNRFNFMPNPYNPGWPLNFAPNAYGFNGFGDMAYNNGPGMYFPNGFYPGY